MCHCSPSMDPQEPAIPAAVGSMAGTQSLGRESSMCMPCTKTRPLLIKRTNHDVSNVVMTPRLASVQEGSGISISSSAHAAVLATGHVPVLLPLEQRVPRAGTAASPRDLHHFSQSILPGLCHRSCSETAVMMMAQVNLTSASPGFNQCHLVIHSPLNFSAPAQFRPGSMQVSLVWILPCSNYSGYYTAAFF